MTLNKKKLQIYNNSISNSNTPVESAQKVITRSKAKQDYQLAKIHVFVTALLPLALDEHVLKRAGLP